ncbi:MAG: threonine synthase [SAR202 cluster bacterium]|nr:threonine synthase [SAR202 cluster bacterium]
MSRVKSLKCRECGEEYPIEPINVCEFCFGPLEVDYDYDLIRKNISKDKIKSGPLTIWRYKDLLPIENQNIIDIGTGFTPLTKATNLGNHLGLNNLYIKNDSVNPTYSFKDRVVSVATTKAVEFEFKTLACVSTGNLMGAVAAHGAKAGMETVVLFPSNLEQAKIVNSSIYGPTLVAIHGTYDEVNRLGSEIADNNPWAFVNINMRPFYAEGSKTLGYEVAEQLDWSVPDHCIVPAASGELHTKIWKGFQEMEEVGLLEKVNSKMHLAQALGCSPIVKAYNNNESQVTPVKPDTIVKSLAIGNPAAGSYALETLKETSGAAVAISDPKVIEGIQLLAETEGIFTETAGGVVISAVKELAENGIIKPDELAVAYITGNGLKTFEVVESTVESIYSKPDYGDLKKTLNLK